MTARPTLPAPTLPASAFDPVKVKQDYEANGPLIVSLDSHDSQSVTMRVRGDDGQLRDAASNTRGETRVSPANAVVYDGTNQQFSAANTAFYPLGVLPSDGMASFCFSSSGSYSSGIGLQYSLNGYEWFDAIVVQANQTGNFNSTTRGYGSNAPYAGSLPPCKFVRIVAQHSTTLNAGTYRFALALSPTVRNDYLMVRMSDGQIADNTGINVSNSTTIYPMMVGAPDASKRARPLSADGSVNPRGQPQNYSYGSIYAPYYANVLAVAISRPDAATYKYDQPAALQTNDRGHLKTESDEMRRIQEQQLLAQQAAYMQSLDPNRGFELR